MISEFPMPHHHTPPSPPPPTTTAPLCNFHYSARNSSQRRARFKFVVQSFHGPWKLNGIDARAVQGRVNSWLLKTQNFLNEVTSPLIKDGQIGKPCPGNALRAQDLEDVFMTEQTIDSRTSNGNLSLAAIVSIEQFSRMNGLTGKKMQRVFAALVPESVYNDARSLVEYCCFRFLSKDTSDIHPRLKEPAFQKLIFVTMLAWENPYCQENVSLTDASGKASFQDNLVREEAFVRIAPAVAGLAERTTAHALFSALASEEGGISLSLWSMFINELLKVHEGRKSYPIREHPQLSKERVLCIGSSRKRPVLKWKDNIAWPGKLTLTDKALYFEAIDLMGQKDAIRLDLTNHGSRVEKTRVGPFGSVLFDSAVSVSSGPENLLSYVFPTSLMVLATGMLLLKGLKEQGRLGRSFGKVTVHDQPPSNTIQKIIAVKGAMDNVENFLQDLNVALLKIRTIVLSGQPQVTTEVALVLLFSGAILVIVPFKYVAAFLLFDLFTRELQFRREMVKKFMRFLKERWNTVPAAPVVVLPFKSEGISATDQRQETDDKANSDRSQEHR